ncbi:MAG: hypothetical protein Q4A42_01925 [Tissierellia bacterium]|nr:hypothetical protein [Tissierellia bacterium]
MKKVWIVILIFSFIISVVACSSEKGTEIKNVNETKTDAPKKEIKDTKQILPEDILSKEDTENLTNLKVEEVYKSEEEAVGMNLVNYGFGVKGFVQISLNHMSEERIKTLYDGMKDMSKKSVDIEGLGDKAFTSKEADNWIYVLKEDYMITICAKDNETAMKIARFATDKLETLLKNK